MEVKLVTKCEIFLRMNNFQFFRKLFFSSNNFCHFGFNNMQIIQDVEFHHCCHSIKTLIWIDESPDCVSVCVVKNIKIGKVQFCFSFT